VSIAERACVNRRARRRHSSGGSAGAIAVLCKARNPASPDRYNRATAKIGFALSETITSLATKCTC
ncbi:hypothetical protein, partial [Klebsiella pneumoniae]|uniref:hypothetical protein n=1 Tax=Klebsiella pneumoniae TaxID=573 RepID=UPI00197A719B